MLDDMIAISHLYNSSATSTQIEEVKEEQGEEGNQQRNNNHR
jgi:hypothetical protein